DEPRDGAAPPSKPSPPPNPFADDPRDAALSSPAPKPSAPPANPFADDPRDAPPWERPAPAAAPQAAVEARSHRVEEPQTSYASRPEPADSPAQAARREAPLWPDEAPVREPLRDRPAPERESASPGREPQRDADAASERSAAPAHAADTPSPAQAEATPKPSAPAEPAHREPPREDIFAAPASAPITMPARAATNAGGASIADDMAWHAIVDASGLRGPSRILAEHAGFVAYADGVLTLALGPNDEHLKAPALIKMVADALASRLGAAPQIRFEAAQAGESLHARNQRARDERQANAEDMFMNDPQVRRLIDDYGAKVVPDSIRPFDEP
ncbi:DNA polymerase III subunit gamma/tau C-terminal domain-containing protein, partial [Pseudomonas sp. CGJS7]|uniref:DNA polymerase III subunit gamma/tau C-terminal domain-containing protein n=1 Tax=Pseudomonas sp. CGJS7 TaxID=3109348 RepID=UPI003B61A103